MDQTDRNALDYESCRRVWRRVSPELDPYPEEREEAGCPAALGNRRACLEAARQAPNPAARRMLQRMAGREEAHARQLMAVYYLACGQCYRPALAAGPGERLPWRQALRQRYHQAVWAARQYDQAARGADDPCLSRLLEDLSREERCQARQLMALLEQNILAF